PYISKMGFDVLYLPPIHPIGTTKRKGKNNAETAQPGDVGSPWAIGSYHGGHTAIEPALGTFDDFRKLVVSATELGLEIAIDLAFQCSPDHPWVSEHPEWFRQRPDGTIQYAENPPKKYQDIYPIDFETESWRSLWQALLDVVLFWAGQDIRIFRVDNPHTKAFPFWEWMIDSVRQQFPDAIFLAEAFTRPKVMGRLAKLGFAQSYTYFTWRNTKEELTQYLTELTASPSREYFRPNLWPNTPDILPEYLQLGGRAGFMIRIGLAATLGASYGIYGPAFELCHSEPRTSGSEEYLNSEKYEIQSPDLGSAWSLRDYIARINAIRKENLALQESWNLQFHEIDNPLMICYSKVTADGANVIVVVVNLDSGHGQAGWTNLDLPSLRIESGVPYQAHDLLGGGRYLWNGPRNYVELSVLQPLHVLQLRRKSRTERDFDYYL
ncbi:MAG: alpha-amylase family glycosyl hydrolase, partial [Candidatus Hydrogenedentes bacterium]|nr:alpha-amylase family glycosyl hydrolase [Candidatus Hydrogenedentota bacterium]